MAAGPDVTPSKRIGIKEKLFHAYKSGMGGFDMLIGDVLAKRAFITPHRPALIFQDQVISYLEFDQRTNQTAQALLELGVKPGDRVGLLMHNCPQFLEVFFATARIGAVLVSLNVRLVAAELDFILDDCGVGGLIYGQDFEDTVAALTILPRLSFRVTTGEPSAAGCLAYEAWVAQRPSTAPDVPVSENDLMAIMYTSGTTGHPKGVMLTHHAVYHAALNMVIGLNYEYPDRMLMLAPFFHTGASSPIVGHVIKGIATVIMQRFDPVATLAMIEKHRIRIVQGVTAMMRMLLDVPDPSRFDLSAWEIAALPGSPLPFALIKAAHEQFGVLCQNLWGMTEIAGPGALMNVEEILDKPDSAGRPYFEVDLRIVDADGRDLPAGEPGELVVRCPHMMTGYWNRPDATQSTIVDGWLHTGDMGYLDQDGYLFIIDRLKDMIVSGGENVYPAEIEKVLLQLPEIEEASVVGIADDKWGEIPKAYIVCRHATPPSKEEIVAFCRQHLAGYKIPRHIEQIDELPKNPSGKVLKKVLRQRS
jgi:fatty-acyl-CoA synthase